MSFPRPIKVTNHYDQKLQLLTGKMFEEVVVSEGIIFLYYLNFIFSSYPKMQSKYPPGSLGILVNGKPPNEFDVLKEGDIVKFAVFNKIPSIS